MSTRTVRILSGVLLHDGRNGQPGDIIEAPEGFARTLISSNKAEAHTPPPPPPAEEESTAPITDNTDGPPADPAFADPNGKGPRLSKRGPK